MVDRRRRNANCSLKALRCTSIARKNCVKRYLSLTPTWRRFMKQRIPYDRAPELTGEALVQHKFQGQILRNEITLEQAKAQGYKEPKDDLFGMSQLMRDDFNETKG